MKFDLSSLARQLPKPEIANRKPTIKKAGDGYFLSDNGLSRAREGDSNIWTVRYTHRTGSPESIEELALLGAAQTATREGFNGFVILSRRNVARTTHVTNSYGMMVISSGNVNSGYETQLRIHLVDIAKLPADASFAPWRVIAAQEVMDGLANRYTPPKVPSQNK